jgi:hypothetical protein
MKRTLRGIGCRYTRVVVSNNHKMTTIKHIKKDKITTPELDKMSAIHKESNAIGGFLDWIGSRDPPLYLCECAREEEAFFPVYPNIEKLLAEFYQIDLNKVEEERRLLLEMVREQNDRRPKK